MCTSAARKALAVRTMVPMLKSCCQFSIAQFGSTRSINASAAAAIAMHTWVTTYADLSGDDAWRG